MINVRLQHISDDCIVSVGNIAYHFNNKEGIVTGLYHQLTTEQKALLAQFNIVPLFENIDRLLTYTFQLQQQYIFFYQDTLEIIRAYQEIGVTHRQHVAYQVGQLRTIIEFNISRGALIKVNENQIEALANHIWMSMDLWVTQWAIRMDKSFEVEHYKDAIWLLLRPFFSNVGQQEYRQLISMRNP